MDRYINKNITKEQAEFLLELLNEEIAYFAINEIEKILKKNFTNIHKIVANLVDKGFLIKLEKGKYSINNFTNSFAIGNFLIKNSAIAYWSALNYWGFTNQIPNSVFVQSIYVKKSKLISNVEYKFIKISKEKFFGVIRVGRGNDKFYITDKEKTILDCFDMIKYSGGFSELIKAFYNAKLDKKKLTDYALKMGNLTLMKRISFLAELLNLPGYEYFKKITLKKLKNKYTVFNPYSQEKGIYISKWKLYLNMKPRDIIKISQNQY